MIERLIYTALKNGVEELEADPLRLELIFGDFYGLSKVEVATIREYFEDNSPSIIHNYARENSPFPLYAIILQGESETTKVLGEYGGMVTFEEAAMLGDTGVANADRFGSIFTYNYDIITYAKLPDVALYYYYLAKYFMIRERDFFIENNMFDLNLGGADLAPDPRYMPAYLFGRTLRFSCQQAMSVIGDPKPRGNNVIGLSIRGGAPDSSGADGEREVTVIGGGN